MDEAFDLKKFKEACEKDVAEGKRPAVGSKVRVLKAARPQYQETIVGRVGIVAIHCLATQGFVNFKKTVTVEYPFVPGGQVITETIFDVAEWEPVPDDIPIGPSATTNSRRKRRLDGVPAFEDLLDSKFFRGIFLEMRYQVANLGQECPPAG